MKSILVATDFSKSSQRVVDTAAKLALDTNSKLLVFHATHIPIVSDTFLDAGITMETIEEADRDSMKALIAVLKDKHPLLKVETLVKIGFPVEEIRRSAKLGETTLVVMGIEHADKFSQVVFGSTSTTLASELSCPVLIVPEKWRYKPLKKIAFAFDQRNIPSGTGLYVLAELKDIFNATFDFVNVLDPNFPVKDDSTLKKTLSFLDEKNPRIHYLSPVRGKIVEPLKDFVRRYRSNTMVMIARQHNILWKLFNERKTKEMAFHTTVPLLIIAEKK